MIIVLDSSVLVAAMIANHSHYLPSLKAIQKIEEDRNKGIIASHTLAECYATLTALPTASPISSLQACEMIEKNILKIFDVIDLTLKDYQQVLKRVAAKNLRSGVIYDALIFQVALKKKASLLLSWNVKDFERVSGGEIEIKTP